VIRTTFTILAGRSPFPNHMNPIGSTNTVKPQTRGWFITSCAYYSPTFAGTHLPIKRDGQAELTWAVD